MVTQRYVRIAEAAAAVGLSPRALNRLYNEGRVRPALVLPRKSALRKGETRWDIDDLKRQLTPPPE
jgi:predicted DNA-binding transcriptional regulator AlpA